MSWYNPSNWFASSLNEEIDAFKNKSKHLSSKELASKSGEGKSDYIGGYGNVGTMSFNNFYSKYINQQFQTKLARIEFFRGMANNPEIADVIEDAINESLQEDHEGKIINLKIDDPELSKKESIIKNLDIEFEKLFNDTLNIRDSLNKWLYRYYIDSEIYTENVIDTNKQSEGLIAIKFLPIETMDNIYDKDGQIVGYVQYLKKNSKKYLSLEEAKKDKDVIVFNPAQINNLKYGYGNETNAYLDKCKVPYNQLKLLETSLIIYRIVRAPERFVFKIDTGNMPREKALKYVEKIKRQMNKKESFDSETGTLTNTKDVLSILDNYFIPQGENRGSDIETIGGNTGAFGEMDDIFYFQKKLYRALKYPLSRIQTRNENRSSEDLFQGNNFNEITRDEIKWSKFLEKQQRKFSQYLVRIFLIHLDFKKIKERFGLNHKNINIVFRPPSDYREQMEQRLLETKFQNYSALSGLEEFSKSYLMKKYLDWTDDEIKENADFKKKDKELGLVPGEDTQSNF